MKNFIIGVLLVGLLGLGGYVLYRNMPRGTGGENTLSPAASSTAEVGATDTPVAQIKPVEVIGQSVEGNDIVAYHFGGGEKEVLFVGGIHGGYEWNTALVAGELVHYLQANPSAVPAGVMVTVIPVLNPDGLAKVVGTSTIDFTAADVASSQSVQVSGRFNANQVDLNRNFDCDWQSKGMWQNKTVSGGAAAFSEPESQAIRSYIAAHTLSAVVVWYSAAGGVYASSCHDAVLPETTALTALYAKASGYKPYESFDFYQTTGDMVNWLAKQGVPAISVLLANHTDTEWTKNLAGVQATLLRYAQ